MSLCYCKSSQAFASCCEPLLSGKTQASHPEEVMRSRYSAFILENYDYLRKTWHPETCPDELESDEPNNWIDLKVLASSENGESGQVEFIAKLIYNDRLEVLHELSNFEKIDGRWLYVDGEFKNDGQKAKKIAKNEACPCGSGKKYKRCHGSSND